ncbi:MAG: hypothetical protein HXX08_23150 [Chloroflexi bacterium]|uniref:Uncharacterized protein n=1 Tax=Candidatus Chlorohelix allophototropha TaxID=3003348 RepID=A0A8T7M9D9_9CHLR|nr:hypothetical protein [Chloroflexota bacterium]WJW68702.1 hypothetical protein OZ401_004318 [Chloroflexota bacterium L227-S17]
MALELVNIEDAKKPVREGGIPNRKFIAEFRKEGDAANPDGIKIFAVKKMSRNKALELFNLLRVEGDPTCFALVLTTDASGDGGYIIKG